MDFCYDSSAAIFQNSSPKKSSRERYLPAISRCPNDPDQETFPKKNTSLPRDFAQNTIPQLLPGKNVTRASRNCWWIKPGPHSNGRQTDKMSLGIISKNFCHEFGARREPSHPQRRIPRPRPVILMKNRTGGANGFNGSISAYMEHDRLVLLTLRKSQTIDTVRAKLLLTRRLCPFYRQR